MFWLSIGGQIACPNFHNCAQAKRLKNRTSGVKQRLCCLTPSRGKLHKCIRAGHMGHVCTISWKWGGIYRGNSLKRYPRESWPSPLYRQTSLGSAHSQAELVLPPDWPLVLCTSRRSLYGQRRWMPGPVIMVMAAILPAPLLCAGLCAEPCPCDAPCDPHRLLSSANRRLESGGSEAQAALLMSQV